MIRRKRRAKRASSLLDAFQMCLEHALARHNRGLKRVADLMGVKYDTLHDWIGSTRMPTSLIAPFEYACGATFVTEYLCANAHLLAVEIPSGRTVTETDVMALQGSFNESVALLIRFYKGEAEADDTVAELTALMGEIGWHRSNVEQHASPELPMFGGHDA